MAYLDAPLLRDVDVTDAEFDADDIGYLIHYQ
jgi:hypothetical protein